MNDEKYVGQTVGWDYHTLNNEFESTYKCSKCGKEEKGRYIYYGNFKNEDGSCDFNHDKSNGLSE